MHLRDKVLDYTDKRDTSLIKARFDETQKCMQCGKIFIQSDNNNLNNAASLNRTATVFTPSEMFSLTGQDKLQLRN